MAGPITQAQQTARILADAGTGLGVAGVSAAVWMDMIEKGLGIVMLIGGLLLLGLRLWLTFQEVKSRKNGGNDGTPRDTL